MAFTGWPREAYDVLLRLQGDPTPSERELVRPDRERLVRVPMVKLLHDLAERDPTFTDHAVWHYRTMLGFWQRQSATIRIDRFVEIGLGFDLDGLSIQGCWWYAPPEQRDRYRAAVAGRPGTRLRRALDRLRIEGYEIGGDVMKRVPRGCPADHPRADLLRHRSVIATRHLGGGDWLHDARALDRVRSAAAELRPLLEWFCDHVVADTAEP